MDIGGDWMKDTEGWMDWEVGVREDKKQHRIRHKWGSGIMTKRGNGIVWGHSQPVTRDKRHHQQTFELGICPPPDS